jgi:hypothetical protein
MTRVFVGAALVIGGIAAFIEAHTHAPAKNSPLPPPPPTPAGSRPAFPKTSPTHDGTLRL